MKNKKVIDEYINPIFRPAKLVVCKHVTEKDLNKKYCWSDGTELEDLGEYDASTLYGVKTKDGKYGVIIIYLNDVLFDKKNYPMDEVINTLAHEALHYAYRLGDHNSFYLDNSTNEVFANLVGYAAQCAYKTYMKQ